MEKYKTPEWQAVLNTITIIKGPVLLIVFLFMNSIVAYKFKKHLEKKKIISGQSLNIQYIVKSFLILLKKEGGAFSIKVRPHNHFEKMNT